MFRHLFSLVVKSEEEPIRQWGPSPGTVKLREGSLTALFSLRRGSSGDESADEDEVAASGVLKGTRGCSRS